MFTGIIQALGTIKKLDNRGNDIRLTVSSPTLDMSDVALGDSIATNGVCLTVTDMGLIITVQMCRQRRLN